MSVTTIEGVVEHGQIRLKDNVSLPENTKVYVTIAEPNQAPVARISTPRLAHPQQAKDFRKQIVEPRDAGL
jgi:hypothetical protein